MTKARTGIMFVHGIAGNNRIFRFLIPHIPQECQQLWITLAGHGGNAEDFSKASMAQWHQQVAEGLEQLSATCQRVIIVGHSMGCLLALTQAARRKVDGLLLLNPPLRIRVRGKAFANVFKALLGTSHTEDSPLDAYGIDIDFNPLHYRGWPKRYLELFRESRIARELVETRSIPSAIIAVAGGADELVSPASLHSFANQPNCQRLLLPTATHYTYTPTDQSTITTHFTTLLQLKGNGDETM